MRKDKYSSKKDSASMKEVSNYSVIFASGFNVILTIFLGGLAGWGLDEWLGTDYWFVVGIILFTLVAIYGFFRSLTRIK